MQQITRDEIERKMDELAREYLKTHNPKIITELYQLCREIEKIEKLEKHC